MSFCKELVETYWCLSAYLAKTRKSNKEYQKIPKITFCNRYYYNFVLVYLD
jgi:hypothetical protein